MFLLSVKTFIYLITFLLLLYELNLVIANFNDLMIGS